MISPTRPRVVTIAFIILFGFILLAVWESYRPVQVIQHYASEQNSQQQANGLYDDSRSVSVVNASSERIRKLEVSFLSERFTIEDIPPHFGTVRRRLASSASGSFVLRLRGEFESGRRIDERIELFQRPERALQISVDSNGKASLR